ncbi:TetR/AcrR family transcriptional regulator [Frateuria aurantia]
MNAKDHTFIRLTRVERQALTRQQILDTAYILFAREGFGGASMETIATEAGFSKGAVYSNFESKEQLFLEVMKRYQNDSLTSVMTVFDGISSAREIVKRLSVWADTVAVDGAWSFLALEYARHVGDNSELRERQIDLIRGTWIRMGEKLRPMFRDELPADAEMLGALVFELTHAPLSGLTSTPTVGQLLEVTFMGLLAAYGRDSWSA